MVQLLIVTVLERYNSYVPACIVSSCATSLQLSGRGLDVRTKWFIRPRPAPIALTYRRGPRSHGIRAAPILLAIFLKNRRLKQRAKKKGV